MEVKTIAHLASTMASVDTAQAVDLAVAKKAMEVQASSAAAMLEALPPAPQLPPHLGRTINTTA